MTAHPLIAVCLSPPDGDVWPRRRIGRTELDLLRSQGVPVLPCLDAVRASDPTHRLLGVVVLDAPEEEP